MERARAGCDSNALKGGGGEDEHGEHGPHGVVELSSRPLLASSDIKPPVSEAWSSLQYRHRHDPYLRDCVYTQRRQPSQSPSTHENYRYLPLHYMRYNTASSL